MSSVNPSIAANENYQEIRIKAISVRFLLCSKSKEWTSKGLCPEMEIKRMFQVDAIEWHGRQDNRKISDLIEESGEDVHHTVIDVA